MNTSTSFSALFAGPACPCTSTAASCDVNAHLCGFPSYLDVPQSLNPSLAADSDLTSQGLFDVELYGSLLTSGSAHTNTFPHDPVIDPDLLHALMHDPPRESLHTAPHEYGYALSTRYTSFHPSAPVEHVQLQSHPVAALPWLPSTLLESPVYPELHGFAPLDDEPASHATSQNVLPARSSNRAGICASPESPPRSLCPSPSSSPSSSPSPHASPELIPCRRRNAPAVLPSSATTSSSDRWKCPHCPYVQRSRRSPDLKRHVETHTRAAWVCCGVPAQNAAKLGVPRDAPLFDFDGVPMAGGCRKVFSRRDALIRHLRKRRGACFGDAGAVYQPGNRDVLQGWELRTEN